MKSKYMAKGTAIAVLSALAGCAIFNPLPPGDAARRAADKQSKLIEEYIAARNFGLPVPRVNSRDYYHESYSQSEKTRIDNEIARAYKEAYARMIQAWIASKKTSLTDKVMKLVQAGLQDAATNGYSQCTAKFEQAREIAWQDCVGAKLEGQRVKEVDDAVQAESVELLATKVNPRQWPVIEQEMRMIADSYCVSGEFEKGIISIKGYPAIRVYTKVLDDRLNAVTEELVKLGMPDSELISLKELARKAMSIAANIADNSDETKEEKKQICLEEGNDPQTEEYRKALEEYKQALIIYNCTPENAERITKALANTVNGLINKLRKDPKYGSEFLKHITRLGASAINKRIDALRVELIGVIEKNRAIYDSEMAQIKELIEKSDLREAQELAVKKLVTMDKKSPEAKFLRPFLINFVTTKINPELWEKIEKELLAKTEEFVAAGKPADGTDWLFKYPLIRTYAEEIDERYADVKKEAVALGVPEATAGRFMDEIMLLTAPMEYLANYDDYILDRVIPGKPLTAKELAKFEKSLRDARKALVDNDCTEANADTLIKEIRARFDPEFAKIGGEEHEQILVLGACALNKRLLALKDSCVKSLIARCASNAAKSGDFAKARGDIISIALTGSDEFDAKAYAVRIGSLNSIVNPLQLAAELKNINDKKDEFVKAGDYRGFRDWARAYPGVHDEYKDILSSVEAIRKAAVGIKVEEQDASDYADKLLARLNKLLEKRNGEYVPPESIPDMSEIYTAVAKLQSAVLAQYFEGSFTQKLGEAIPKEVLELLRKVRPESLTTWDLNERLQARIDEILKELDIEAMIVRQEYLELLARMNDEFSYDSQIAMAEDAIAKQLGVKCSQAHSKGNCSAAHLFANAVLGEYARSMRLLKMSAKLTDEQKTTLAIGAVYLDQPAVFDRVMGLGADVNAVSPRDPLKRTPLLFAIQLGRVAFVHRLVAAGADVTLKDVNDDTAVHYAVRRGNLAVLNAMLVKNDVNAKNKDGATALFDAARQDQAPLVEALVAAKADVSIADAKGRTAFDFACENGSSNVLDPLAAAGSEYGPKQLAIAAAHDFLGVAQWLVTHGTDVNGEGVMGAAKCGTDTKHYLVHEGGVAPVCECAVCSHVKIVVAPAEKQTAEANGSINFTIRESK